MNTRTEITLSHDAFGRFEFVRTSHWTDGECAWCGAHRKVAYYGYRPDDNPSRGGPMFDHAFCSVGCFRSYHT